MKILFSFLFISVFCFQNCFAQDASSSVIFLNSIPPEGVLLDKGWKFKAGDNTEYAKAGYNDSNWKSIDPTKDINDLPELWNTNICWLRLHVTLDSSLATQNLSFLIAQTGASEIYLNGNLLTRLGTIATDSLKNIAVSPPNRSFIPFLANQAGTQVLAVRFALQKNAFYFTFVDHPNLALALTLTETKAISDNINDTVPYYEFTRFGLYFILAVLHLALFAFNRSQKANLYFFIYAFFESVSLLMNELTLRHVSLLSTKMQMGLTFYLLADLSALFFILAVYKVFHYEKRLIFWFVTAAVVAFYFLPPSSQLIAFWMAVTRSLVPTLEVMRVSLLAIKARQRGAGIVTAGTIIFLVFLFLFIFFAFGYIPPGPDWLYGSLAYNIMAISFPVTISVYLALDASYVSRMLQKKLTEVQQLSMKTITQEKEKQEFLSSLNETLETQVTERTAELKQSLDNLRSTQSQLIHSEKMASLGELTAGIAHEIQNPLNFVNNFSDLNKELIVELKEEIDAGNVEDVKAIANDIQTNEEKISHHGKRAQSIVTGMLQHSRTGKGEKQLTDINKLADEYLRLSYHGVRAKDKDFNCDIETSFDESIGQINIIPQEIGRVILNLVNNAFYAVNERARSCQAAPPERGVEALTPFKPTVTVTTKKESNHILISVADNGNGIPEKIKDKIFNPFFTTKPTGQGTGLGLSLSYDIVKAHGGEIKVETNEREGSEFIIQLPV